MRQIADKIAHLMWIFGKRKAVVQCSHDCLELVCRVAQNGFADLQDCHKCAVRKWCKHHWQSYSS